jgi:predicted nuclease of restriction endonuclease-like (RecB) superfamily
MTSSDEQTSPAPAAYGQLLDDIKTRIRRARVSAALAVNRALIELYWEIGNEILERERAEGWGAKVIDRLAADHRREFPDMTGLSRSNLHYMRAFAHACPTTTRSQSSNDPLDNCRGVRNIGLLTKLTDVESGAWYARKAVEHGWSRPVLEAQIATVLQAALYRCRRNRPARRATRQRRGSVSWA